MAIDPTIPPPPPPPPASVTDEERMWGMLSHLSALLMLLSGFGQFIAPLVIYVIYKDKSKFIAFHALEELYFQLAMLAISLVTCGIGLIGALPLAIIVPIIAGIKANDGMLFEYWVVGPMARRQVGI